MKFFTALVMLLSLSVNISAQAGAKGGIAWGHEPMKKACNGNEPWKLAIQAFSFHQFTMEEAIEKTSALGIMYLEAFPGHKLSNTRGEATFGPWMSDADLAWLQEKLAVARVKIVAMGVYGMSADEAECRKVFEFAKKIGVETITAEPDISAMKMIDRLCQEYSVNIAIHNHPEPSFYASPDRVLEACAGLSARVGSCADTGHWLRSGLVSLESVKKLEGRIISLHMKDLNIASAEGHDVHWGEGVTQLDAIFEELARQNFRGVISIEYEYNWDDSVPDIRECVKFFDRTAAKYGRPCERWLFNGSDLSAWQYQEGAWTVEEGILCAKGPGDIWTKEQYGNFILDLEFKNNPHGNSGVFLRTADIVEWLHTGIEVQVLDSYGVNQPTIHDCGAIFDCLAPISNPVKPAGEWNHYRIACVDNIITVTLNGVAVTHMNLDLWTQAHRNPDGSENKFNTAYKDMARSGAIGLQFHGDPVWYRNIKIKRLAE